jgi:phage terminase large subunit
MTDDKTAKELKGLGMDKHAIVADNEDPKAIQYYNQEGFRIRGCKKWAGSRLANTKKVKRFRRIICSPECPNTIRELKTLTYAKDSKDMPIYDEFNIDPHTFSAIWYGLDTYTVADIKERKSNSRKGG